MKPHEDLRGIKKRDRFKESEVMTEEEFQFLVEWLNKNEKRLIDEIGDVIEQDS